MTEINVEQMIEADNIGKELIRRGWSQGSLLKIASASKMYLIAEKPTPEDLNTTSTSTSIVRWLIRQETSDGDDFIIVSQPCDIQKPPKHEPYVEVMPVCWTNDRGIIHEASRNSIRYFLLKRHRSDAGQEEAHIVDATIRLLLEKASLLYLEPLVGIQANDRVILRLFRRWLARRYDRPALEDDLVNAVQKPIVKAIGKLRTTDPLQDILDGVGEVLFLLQSGTLPYQMVLLFIRTERSDIPQISIEQAANLAGWIDDVLKKAGNAKLIDWHMFGTDEISLKDYTNAFKLPLDQYSLHLDES
jgi:hypothetical protein